MTGAGPCLLTAGRRSHLTARMGEHGADALRAMVEWLTGCRCGTCHACKWSQPKGYTGADTYLRPDNCAKYVEAARERGVSAPTSGEDWTEADACRTLVTKCLPTGAVIDPSDDRTKYLGRRMMALLGGRDDCRVRSMAPDWTARWRAAWPGALADWANEQERRKLNTQLRGAK